MEEQARAVRLIELTLYPYCMNVTSDPVIYYYSHCSILLFCLPPFSLVPDRDTGYEHKSRQNSLCQRPLHNRTKILLFGNFSMFVYYSMIITWNIHCVKFGMCGFEKL